MRFRGSSRLVRHCFGNDMMRADFALDLSEEGIVLLRYVPEASGWVPCGSASLDGQSLDKDMRRLEDIARELSGGRFATKLILPPSQLLYAEITVGSDPDADIKAQLESRTPYKIGELLYDVSGTGAIRQIVAVARDTLDEAKGFIGAYGFNPVGFTAIPAAGVFRGEPNLGPFGDGPGFTPSSKAIRRISEQDAQEALKAATELARLEALVEADSDDASDAEVELLAGDLSPSNGDTSDAKADDKARRSPGTVATSSGAAQTPPTDVKAGVADVRMAEQAETAAPQDIEEIDKPTLGIAVERDATAPSHGIAARSSRTSTEGEKAGETSLPAASDTVSEPEISPEPEIVPEPEITPVQEIAPVSENSPEPDSAAARPVDAFGTVREGSSAASPSMEASRTADAGPPQAVKPPVMAPVTKPASALATAARAPRAPAATAQTSAIKVPRPAAAPPLAAAAHPALQRGPGSARPVVAPKADGAPDPIAALAAREASHTRSWMAAVVPFLLVGAFVALIALGWRSVPPGGLAFLWQDNSEMPIAVIPIEQEEAGDLAEIRLASLPAEEDLFETDLLEPELPIFEAEPIVDEPALPTPVEVIEEPEIVAPVEIPGPLSPVEAHTAYAVTGIWQRAPDMQDSVAPPPFKVEQILDREVVLDLSEAPLMAARFEPAIVEPSVSLDRPAPPGMRFDLDERRLVRPTPEGAMSPQGVMVYLGRPDVEPQRRPGPPTTEEEIAEAELQAVAERQALAVFVPQARPEAITLQAERLAFGGFTRQELLDRKPPQRPSELEARAREVLAIEAETEAQAVQQIAPETGAPTAEAIDEALAEVAIESASQVAAASLVPRVAPQARPEGLVPEPAEPDAAQTGTDLAVARSMKPPARPNNMASIVASVRRSTQQPAAAPQPELQTASASTAGVRGSGPAVSRSSRARPTGPTRSFVAKAATDNNALAMGRVSLVGVFGTASNRRALVRLPNGRFRKVSVGDRVDGGRVAAIGASDLRYTKSGRTLTLQMPRG